MSTSFSLRPIPFPASSLTTLLPKRVCRRGLSWRCAHRKRCAKLVEAGVGISFLPQMSVRESVEGGALRLVEVKGMSFDREIGLAWRRGRYFGPSIRQLLEAILAEHDALDEWHALVP